MAIIKARCFMLFAVTGLLAGLAGCGGGDGGSETETAAASQRDLQGAAVKGPLQQTSIGLFEFDSSGQISRTGEEPLFEAVTDAQGNFQIPDLPGNLSALITASGGGFFDESDPSGARFIQWPETAELFSFKSASLSTVAITPLSDYLVRKSRRDAAAGLDFTHSMNENRRQLREALGFDPLSVLPPNPTQPPPGASEDELRYAMFLGGVAMAVNSAALGMGLPEPDFDVLWALLNDLEDCSLDGRRFGTVLHVNDQPLPTDINLDQEIRRFRNNNFDRLGSAGLVTVDQQLCANALPRAVDDNATTSSGVEIEIPVLANDTDADGSLDKGTLQITTQPANGQAEVVPGTGRIRYLPGEEFVGSDSLRYRVEDNLGARSNVATVSITVGAGNGPPVALDDSFTVEQDGFFDTHANCDGICDLLDNEEDSVLGNDSDPDGDTLSLFEIVTSPQFAHIEGGFGMDPDGRFFYEHDGSDNFTDSFTYRATDGSLLSNTATVNISITPVATCVSPPADMVAWYTGDAAHTNGTDINDIQGGNTGELRNGATGGVASGTVDESMSFDGIDDVVQVDGLAGFAPADLTIDAWVRFNALTNADEAPFQTIAMKRRNQNAVNHESFILSLSTEGADARFMFFGFQGQEPRKAVLSTTVVQPGIWYHVAGVLREGELEIYVNGALEATNPAQLVLEHDNTEPVYIGGNGPDGGDANFPYQMDGLIDELEIFDRALDATEIADIYNAGVAGKCKPDLSSDNDGDNLTLAVELALGTNPNNPDTDGDGHDDDVEIAAGNPALYEPALGDSNPLDSQSFPGAACLSPPAGMVAWYTGDSIHATGSNVFDIQGGNGGELRNGATSGAETAGVVAETMSFDGVNDVAQVDGLAAFAPTDLTIDAWVYFDALANADGSAYQAVAMKRRNVAFGQFESYMLGLESLESRFVFLGFQGQGNVPINDVLSTTVVEPGVWYHITGVLRDGEMEIHVNGTLEAVNPGPLVLEHNASQPVFIGGNGPNGGDANFPYQMDGRIDELEIFDRALDTTEIAAIYNAGITGKCKPGLSSDNDGDNLTLAEELALGTNPNSADTDGDGHDDDVEIAAGDPALYEPGMGDSDPLNSLSVPGSACVSPPAGMVAWFTGDAAHTDGNKVEDIAGGNTGVLLNDATSGEEAGVVAEGMGFDGGVQDNLEVPGLSTFASQSLTIDAWVNIHDLSETRQAIVTKRNDDFLGFETFYLGLTEAGKPGERYFVFGADGSGFDAGANSFEADDPIQVQANTWYHVAGTFEPVGQEFELRLYVDGVLVHSALREGGLNYSDTRPVYVGGNNETSQFVSFYLNGRIDEVEIFDRTLDPGEIEAIYNVGSLGKCKGN